MVEDYSLNSEEPTDPFGPLGLTGFLNWRITTAIGVFAGMLDGGRKEASASVSKDAKVVLKFGSTSDKREQHRWMRDAMEKRFLRIAQGSIVEGVRFGMPIASFFGIIDLLAEKRGVHDVFNVVAAGSTTHALFSGLLIPGSLRRRAMNMAVGSVLGAAYCFPLGWIQVKMLEKTNECIAAAHPDLDQREVKSGVSAATERLEKNSRK